MLGDATGILEIDVRKAGRSRKESSEKEKPGLRLKRQRHDRGSVGLRKRICAENEVARLVPVLRETVGVEYPVVQRLELEGPLNQRSTPRAGCLSSADEA